MMWVYIETERFKDDNGQIHILWTVGFYDPSGNFCGDSDHDSIESAAARVHYLNGGIGKEYIKTILKEIEHEKLIGDKIIEEENKMTTSPKKITNIVDELERVINILDKLPKHLDNKRETIEHEVWEACVAKLETIGGKIYEIKVTLNNM